MFRIARAHTQPIGVDLGVDSVKLLQLEATGGHLRVVAAERQYLTINARADSQQWRAAALDALRRMLHNGGFAGRHIITALPRDIVQTKNIRLPQMPDAELAAAVDFEARNIFSFDVEAAQVRYLHAGEVRQGSDAREEVIVLAAKNDDVNEFVEQLHRCGAVIESLDFEPCALYRSVERFIRRREDEQEVHIIVDVGARLSTVLIGRGREISFVKSIDIGGQSLQETVSRKLGISLEEARALRRRLIDQSAPAGERRDSVRQAVYDATRSVMETLAREIALCLRYHSVTFRGHRRARVRIAGAEASDPQLLSILNSHLPLPAEPLQPMLNTDTHRMSPADRAGSLAEWTVAFGLGLKLTKEYFSNPQGKRREAPRETRPAAEVIDLTAAVAEPGREGAREASRDPGAASTIRTPSFSSPQVMEVSRA